MHYLYCIKPGADRKLAATFDSEPQLLAYVRWATLLKHRDDTTKFEQGSALVGCMSSESSESPLTPEDATFVPHNPSPSML